MNKKIYKISKSNNNFNKFEELSWPHQIKVRVLVRINLLQNLYFLTVYFLHYINIWELLCTKHSNGPPNHGTWFFSLNNMYTLSFTLVGFLTSPVWEVILCLFLNRSFWCIWLQVDPCGVHLLALATYTHPPYWCWNLIN